MSSPAPCDSRFSKLNERSRLRRSESRAWRYPPESGVFQRPLPEVGRIEAVILLHLWVMNRSAETRSSIISGLPDQNVSELIIISKCAAELTHAPVAVWRISSRYTMVPRPRAQWAEAPKCAPERTRQCARYYTDRVRLTFFPLCLKPVSYENC